MVNWTQYVSALSDLLSELSIRRHQEELGIKAGMEALIGSTQEVKRDGGCVYWVGNGASASMASHMSADMAKTTGMKTAVFTDMSLLTATANDFSYDQVFALPLRWNMVAGDMLVAISSSGNSPNVVNAVRVAEEIGGKVVTFSAMSADNAIRGSRGINLYVPAQAYGLAETAHAAILHYWTDQMAFCASRA